MSTHSKSARRPESFLTARKTTRPYGAARKYSGHSPAACAPGRPSTVVTSSTAHILAAGPRAAPALPGRRSPASLLVAGSRRQAAPRPLAPRARVEPHAGPARHLERQHQVRGAHARAAVGDDLGAVRQLVDPVHAPELLGGQQAPTAEPVHVRPVHRAGDVAGDGVEGFDLAAVALRRPGV